jgi:hypothetical protein
MNPRQISVVIGLAAAVIYLFRGPTEPLQHPPPAGATSSPIVDSSAHGSPAPAGTAPSPPATLPREYVRLYRDLLGMESPAVSGTPTVQVRGNLAAQPLHLVISSPPSVDATSDGDLNAIAQRAEDEGRRLEFMIVLAADPTDSGLASDFDLTMSALQYGLAEANYKLDRQWLPWVAPEAAEARAFQETAGLMLFQRSSPDPQHEDRRLLAVLVVGETLKLGIAQPALRHAVDFILRLHAQEPTVASGAKLATPPAVPHCLEIPILGPSYSGSVSSLREALGHAPANTCFRIISGSASAPNLQTRLEAPLSGAPTIRVWFTRTVVSDDLLAARGLGFLQNKLGWNLNRAALLVERDTAYGSYWSASKSNPLLDKITKLRIPSGVFALRNAWEASAASESPAQAMGSNPNAFSTPKTALEVSLADQRPPVDVIAEMSPLTARIYDVVSADELRQISREGYSYIGILATDVKDQLFLAEQIRRWAPNMILFVIDNHLLYVHPQYITATFGMLTISSFPLWTEGGRRMLAPATPEPRIRHQFASERHEGTFHAVHDLIHSKATPPPDVWIGTTGNYANWPLARLGGPLKDSLSRPPLYDAAPERLGPSATDDSSTLKSTPERTDLALLLLISLTCLASYLLRDRARSWVPSLASILASRPSQGRAEPLNDLPADPWRQIHSGHAPSSQALAQTPAGERRSLRLSLLILVIWVFLLSIFRRRATTDRHRAANPGPRNFRSATSGVTAPRRLRPAVAQSRKRLWLSSAAALPCMAGSFIVVLSAIGMAAGIDRSALLFSVLLLAAHLYSTSVFLTTITWPAPESRSRLRQVTARVLSLFALESLSLLLAYSVFRLWRATNAVDAGLLYLRARAFSGGDSPLVSLAWLAAACFFWLVVELKRQGLFERHSVQWPLRYFADPGLQGFEQQSDIENLLRTAVASNGKSWLIIAFLVGPPTLFLVTRLQPIGESRWYGLVFLTFEATLSMLSAASFVRFLRVWSRLRGILRRIAHTDLLEALKSVASELGWNPSQFGGYKPSFSTSERSVEHLQRMIDRRILLLDGREEPARLLKEMLIASSDKDYVRAVSYRTRINRLCEFALCKLADKRAIQGVDEFYAIRLAAYLRHVLNQLRYSVMGAMGCGLALTVGISTYAFQPKDFAMLLLWSMLAAASIATLIVFVQMERDATLSAIGSSAAGKVTYDWAFLSKLLVYNVVPVLGLIASRFPSAGRLFNSMIDPLLRALGGG